VVLSSGQQVDVAHLPLYLQESGPIRVSAQEGFVQAKERVVAMFEKEAVTRFLSEARGNISVAAKKAGITRRNFHRLLSKYSINTKKFKAGS
jgi:DNA-binding NtrC family response regulator